MARYTSPGHPLSASWWGDLCRVLTKRPAPPSEEREGLSALFVRKREVRQQEISTRYIRSPQHISHIADLLIACRPVIVNLEELKEDERQRALDFISGVVYALDGSYEPVGEQVFLFVPGNVEIVEDE